MSFANKLYAIRKELCNYSEAVFTDMTPQKYFIVNVKYGVMMQAIQDLHGSNIKQQQLALDYLRSDNYANDCEAVGLSKHVMDRIVFNPDQYADKIGYVEPKDDEHELFDGE